jgi:hypothetical protein
MEECRMAWSLARDAEDFARLILRTVERLGQDGGWVPAGQALEQTLAEHPDHAYVGKLRAKSTRRIGLSAIAETGLRGRVPAPRATQGRHPAQRPGILSDRATRPGTRSQPAVRDCGEPSAARAPARGRGKTPFPPDAPP